MSASSWIPCQRDFQQVYNGSRASRACFSPSDKGVRIVPVAAIILGTCPGWWDRPFAGLVSWWDRRLDGPRTTRRTVMVSCRHVAGWLSAAHAQGTIEDFAQHERGASRLWFAQQGTYLLQNRRRLRRACGGGHCGGGASRLVATTGSARAGWATGRATGTVRGTSALRAIGGATRASSRGGAGR